MDRQELRLDSVIQADQLLKAVSSRAAVELAKWPRISLVTAVLNSVRYIEQTVLSVINQGYPNLEYVIVDGGSTDGTVEIIRKYENHLAWWVSEPDRGHFHALNKGFARSSGEIMGWINGSDQLHTGGLRVVGSVFAQLPEVEWITGLPTGYSEEGMTVGVGQVPHWSRWRFLAGANRYIQQESTYWRRALWDRAGGRVDDSSRIGNDFELWVRFFRHAQLYPVQALIGGYRYHPDAVMTQKTDEVNRLYEQVIDNEIELLPWWGWFLNAARKADLIIKRIPKIRGLWWRAFMKQLYEWSGPDCPPVIRYVRPEGWKKEP